MRRAEVAGQEKQCRDVWGIDRQEEKSSAGMRRAEIAKKKRAVPGCAGQRGAQGRRWPDSTRGA